MRYTVKKNDVTLIEHSSPIIAWHIARQVSGNREISAATVATLPSGSSINFSPTITVTSR